MWNIYSCAEYRALTTTLDTKNNFETEVQNAFEHQGIGGNRYGCNRRVFQHKIHIIVKNFDRFVCKCCHKLLKISSSYDVVYIVDPL